MHRKRVTTILGVSALWSLGLTAWLAIAPGPAAGQAGTHAAAKATSVTVTVGKPSELAFKLSKSSALPAGPVTFKVTNKGAITHDFKICTNPVATSKANSCVGKVTKRLKAGQTATLTVTLKKAGKYEFLCTVPGHANAGMKGLLGVGVKVTNPTPTPTPTPAPAATTPAPAPAPGASTCASPVATTVTVNEFDFGFTLSPTTAPCGRITFTMMNTGQTVHDFVIPGTTMNGGRLNAGQSATVAATIGPGTYSYICTVEGHDALGMVGMFRVT
jgi:nitrite reductase (NO-forming)